MLKKLLKTSEAAEAERQNLAIDPQQDAAAAQPAEAANAG